jgi:hypothetical protein
MAVVLVAGLSLATGFAQAPAERKLQIAFDGSNVTLTAANVSIPEILSEWSRLSGSVMVNAERLSRVPLPAPMVFENQPQKVVLDALLRHAAGYIVTPRLQGQPGATDFGVVYILPTSNPTASAYSGFSTPIQPAISSVDPPEVPPIPPAPPPPADNAPPATSPGRSNSPGVFVPIISVPPAPGRGGTPPTTTGRGGRGGL